MRRARSGGARRRPRRRFTRASRRSTGRRRRSPARRMNRAIARAIEGQRVDDVVETRASSTRRRRRRRRTSVMAIVRFKGYGEVEVPVGTSLLEAAQKVARARGVRLRRRLRLLDVPRLRDARGASSSREQEDEEADILDKAFDVRAHVAPRLSVEDRERRRDRGRDHAREPRGVRERAPRGARQVRAAG